MNMLFPFFDDEAVRSVLDYTGVTRVLDEAFSDLATGGAGITPRTRADCGSVKLSAMGGVWHSRGVAGVKVYPTINGRFNFLINLFDLDTSKPAAILEGNEITRFRTASIVNLVAFKCMNKSAVKVALFGAGVQGRSIVAALASSLAIVEVSVVDPALNEADFAKLSRELGVLCRASPSKEAVEDADLVVTATRSKSPVFDGAWLKPGCFVAAVGTSLPNGRELDDATFRRATRVIVEWKEQSMTEAGEVVLSKATGALTDEKIVDLPELYSGHAPWRADSDEIIVFKSVGVGLSDVATSWLVKERASSIATANSLGSPASKVGLT
jgi:ornithine cyclodeaminase